MIKKQKKILITLMIMMIAASMTFTGCFGKAGSEAEISEKADSENEKLTEDEIEEKITKDYENGIVFDEETEGYEVKVKKEDPTKFVGSWEATSGNAHYLLGNLDLKIKADGTWKGNVSDQAVSGTWTEKDGGIYLSCSDKNINFGGQLAFTPEGTLVYSYLPLENSTEPLNVVLTKKGA